jgi:peptidoglycan hydrolase CwlO-like protein
MIPKKLLTILILFSLLFTHLVPTAQADDLDDINKQLTELTTALNQSIAATKPLESQLTSLATQITGIKGRVNNISAELDQKEKNIASGYKTMEKQQEILNRTVRDFYIKSYYNSPLLAFLSGQTASSITKVLAYQQVVANRDKAIITNIALSISDLEEKSIQLKGEQSRLLAAKTTLDVQFVRTQASALSGDVCLTNTTSQACVDTKSKLEQIAKTGVIPQKCQANSFGQVTDCTGSETVSVTACTTAACQKNVKKLRHEHGRL